MGLIKNDFKDNGGWISYYRKVSYKYDKGKNNPFIVGFELRVNSHGKININVNVYINVHVQHTQCTYASYTYMLYG
jgi:hypothetical protein